MSTRKIYIHGVEYVIKEKEFLEDSKYTPLIMRKDLSQMDREIYVLRRLGSVFSSLTFVNYGVSHGEYVYKNVSEYFGNSMVVGDLGGVSFATNNLVLRVDTDVDTCKLNYLPLVILCSSSDDVKGYKRYMLGERYLFIRGFDVGVGESKNENSSENISCDKIIGLLKVDGVDIDLDNLLHVLYMIKDSGDGFRDVLMKNFRYADRVTILDTGSTDDTLRVVADVIRELGCENIVNVYEEPFIDFGSSRNRLMDLADNFKVGGEVLPKCAFQIMLDDTYVIEDGDKLRSFLTEVRCDDEAPSLSIYINGTDVLYSSIRLFRPDSGIRYKYKIHEIPDCDTSALIPKELGSIMDVQSKYMRDRTVERKVRDLEMLFEEQEKDPDDPRILYYIAETYLVMEDWKNAFDYYNKRVLHRVEGFNEERYDAMYKAAVMADLHLGYDWSKVMGMYLECYKYDITRPESLFMVGSHYYNHEKDVNLDLAYIFLRLAFECGLPLNANMNFKVDQYNYYLPKWLIDLCYYKGDSMLGMIACERMLSYKSDWNTGIWHNIFSMLNKYKSICDGSGKSRVVGKKTVMFLSPGGWDKWDGETLYKSGIGGSETFSIKYAEWLGKFGYSVVVFCDCVEDKYYNGVMYKKLDGYMEYLSKNHVDYCLVNRYFEHLYVLREAGVENVYFVYHDIASPEQMIPFFPNLKGVLFISNWAREQFHSIFENISRDMTKVISYGIDVDKFVMSKIPNNKRWFMYSSFANRGLLELLKMFPRIVERYPDAVLNVFCDLDNDWLLKHHSGQVEEIKVLLKEQEKHVINHGWVNQKMLNAFWSMSGIWFYPCTFAETCCLTSYEAAASRTLAISNDLGALKENSSIVIPGDASSDEWKDRALGKLFELMDDEREFDRVVESNFEWVVEEKSFDKVVSEFIKKL